MLAVKLSYPTRTVVYLTRLSLVEVLKRIVLIPEKHPWLHFRNKIEAYTDHNCTPPEPAITIAAQTLYFGYDDQIIIHLKAGDEVNTIGELL